MLRQVIQKFAKKPAQTACFFYSRKFVSAFTLYQPCFCHYSRQNPNQTRLLNHMHKLINKPLLVLLAGLTSSVSMPVPEVEAQTLFDLLFKNDARRQRDLRRERERLAKQRVIRKKPRVKTARIYNYKPVGLSKVSFATLSNMPSGFGFYGPQTVDFDPETALFADAAIGLEGYSVNVRKDVGKAVLAHYKAHPKFMWVNNLQLNEASEALMQVLSSANEYGLDPADYQFENADGSPILTLEALIKFDISLTLRAVRYGLDANNGRINPNKLSGYHDFARKKFSAKKMMAALYETMLVPKQADSEVVTGTVLPPVDADLQSADADQPAADITPVTEPQMVVADTQTNENSEPKVTDANNDVTAPDAVAQPENNDTAKYLLSLHPTHSAFNLFRDELTELRQSVDDSVVVAPDTFVRPGKSHKEMPNIIKAIAKRGSPELLERHGDVLAAYDGSEIYSDTLVDLVKDFQKENKLKPDGIVGSRSVSKMSDVPIASKIDRVVLAMERLRWHPRDFGNRHVFINQPAYRASYLNNGSEALSMRVVVGKPSNQTNFFYDKIERVVYNPYWGVPRSILVNEMLPKLRNNPGYLDQRGYEVTTISGKRISSSSVDWYGVGANFGYNVRQTPGPRNALGELKILFPNKHNIYMHDTPSKSLFKRTKRALSHGCVRLQRPRQMAAAVLGTNINTIRSKLGAGHNSQNLKQQIPVYVAYFTAWPSDSGKVLYYSDMYKRDKRLLKAIKKTSASRNAAQS